jgi:hypothetical protein
MKQKIHVAARISEFNYDMIKAVADTMFLNETRNDGDFSKAIDWILTTFRLKSEFKDLIKLLQYYDRYQHGERTEEVLQKTKEFQIILKSLEHRVP